MTKDRKQKKKFGINITIYFTILISLVIILTIAAASAVAYVLNFFSTSHCTSRKTAG